MNDREVSGVLPAPQHGFGLVEFLVAGVIGAVLVVGLMQVAAATRNAFVLQEGMAELQENERLAFDRITRALGDCGFTPKPWSPVTAWSGACLRADDRMTSRSDRVAIRSLSDRNCFDALNTQLDDSGQPAFFAREAVLERNGAGSLVLSCRFGPDEESLITQISRQGLLNDVESFQVLFAEDTDGDDQADRWVRAGGWTDSAAVVGIRAGVLLASREPVGAGASAPLRVLDEVMDSPRDGRLRRVVTIAHALRVRVP